jgi:hypothetical protein
MKRYLVLTLFFILVTSISAQTDTLIFKNGNMLVGEIKSMSRGIISIETDFSDSDFMIEWEKVVEIHSKQEYIISLDNGEREKSTINTDPSDKSKLFLSWSGNGLQVVNENVVYIKPVEDKFIDRLNASIDLGFSLTKANNLKQFTLRSYIGYMTDTWSADGSLDAVRSSQDSIANTERTDASIGINYFIGKNWFTMLTAKFLQNDEQKLELRATPKAGIGNYVIQTNYLYLGI